MADNRRLSDFVLYIRVGEIPNPNDPERFYFEKNHMSMADNGRIKDNLESLDGDYWDRINIMGTSLTLERLNLGEKTALEKCAELNKAEVERAERELAQWREKAASLPGSDYLPLYVAYHEAVVGRYHAWYWENGVEYPQHGGANLQPAHSELRRESSERSAPQQEPGVQRAVSQEEKDKDTQLAVAHDKVKHLTKRVKMLTRPKRMDLIAFADDCRFRNDKINYSKLAKEKLGVSNKTARKWCDEYGIS